MRGIIRLKPRKSKRKVVITIVHFLGSNDRHDSLNHLVWSGMRSGENYKDERDNAQRIVFIIILFINCKSFGGRL